MANGLFQPAGNVPAQYIPEFSGMEDILLQRARQQALRTYGQRGLSGSGIAMEGAARASGDIAKEIALKRALLGREERMVGEERQAGIDQWMREKQFKEQQIAEERDYQMKIARQQAIQSLIGGAAQVGAAGFAGAGGFAGLFGKKPITPVSTTARQVALGKYRTTPTGIVSTVTGLPLTKTRAITADMTGSYIYR